MNEADLSALLSRLRSQGASLRGLSADSRTIQAGDLFLAYPGHQSDGRNYIRDALARGASAVLWDTRDGFQAQQVPGEGIDDLRKLAGHLAHQMFGRPSERLWLAGVTGTNGKTTVSQWLAMALEAMGVRSGVIGTLGSGFPGKLRAAFNTTPDGIELHRTLAEFIAQGAEAATLEVSSIGIDQGRINGAEFQVAIFTNLSHDHLDYHGDMEHYVAAKMRFFDEAAQATCVINLDDAYGVGLARRLTESGRKVLGYTRASVNREVIGSQSIGVLLADRLQLTPSGLRFTLVWGEESIDLQVRLVAQFNVSNLLAVAGALLARGESLTEVARVVARLTPPEGRMQILGGVGEPLVVVDYAHTPDALAKVLEAMRDSASTRRGRLIVVFGCGGDRDAAKRPLMGAAARMLSDQVILTSDNPRSESPEAILDAIAPEAGSAAVRMVDRAAAIRYAITQAAADDVIVLAGKGHEPYQEVQGQRLPFSDVEQARAALAQWSLPAGGTPT